MKLVVDTNVLVSSLLSPFGTCALVHNLILEGAATPVVDARILSEYRHVLLRSKFGFDARKVSIVLEYWKTAAWLVNPPPTKAILKDSDDQIFLDALACSGADWLITGNTRDFSAAPADLRKKITTPGKFISALWKD